MDFVRMLMDVKFWIQLIQDFQNLGPFGPVLFAASESIFSFLPFIAIVTFHVSVYGEVLGFLYSWLGTTIGSIAVFIAMRFCSEHFVLINQWKFIKKLKQFLNIEHQWGLFLITSCAFMPSFFINVAYGVSDFNTSLFLKTIVFSKAIMTGTLVLFGSSMKKAMHDPIFIIFAILIFFILFLLSKQLKKIIQSKKKTNK